VGNNTGGPNCEQETMASSSGMNQNEFFLSKTKNHLGGKAWKMQSCANIDATAKIQNYKNLAAKGISVQ
jgi:hypothetical protein